MRLFRKTKETTSPQWRLSITPGLIEHRRETIDGIQVTFDKMCWTWNVLRDEPHPGQLWDMGVADTEDEALRIGLEKVKARKLS